MTPIVDTALVIKHIDFRESDRIVTLMTRDHGRISGLARGVRRSVKRFAGRLDLFNEVQILFRHGRGELVQLDSASLISAHLGIRNTLLGIAWAGYLAELTERLFGIGEPHPAVFDTLSLTYLHLERSPETREGLLRLAELRLLLEAGIHPALEACGMCGEKVVEGKEYRFLVTRGGVLCGSCESGETGILVQGSALLWLYHGSSRDLSPRPDPEPSLSILRDCRALARAFVQYQMGGPLRTRDFLEGLNEESEGPR